jgi:hypothetical protein
MADAYTRLPPFSPWHVRNATAFVRSRAVTGVVSEYADADAGVIATAAAEPVSCMND